MTLEEIKKEYDKLQTKYGDKTLHSIYFGGKEQNPDYCFVFMNPTAGNIATKKDWDGPRYPWLGTKNVWKLFYQLELITKKTLEEIQNKKQKDWDIEFCEKVYQDLKKHNVYITNLAKCSQLDARPLKDDVYKKYLKLFWEEIKIINPKTMILFGNQVSSIVLDKKIKVSEVRKQEFIKNNFSCYSVYYPVGNGSFNIDKAIEDIMYIKNINNLPQQHTTLLFLKKNNKILLGKKKRGFKTGIINGIGGKVQDNEKVEDAMIRECKEEIGVIPTTYKLLGIITYIEYKNNEKIKVRMYVYTTTKWEGEIIESEEIIPAWYKKDSLPWDTMFEDLSYFLPKILENKKIKAYFEYDKNYKLISNRVEEVKKI